MSRVGFELTMSAGERPQTYALDRAATGIGIYIHMCVCVCACVRVYVWQQKLLHDMYTIATYDKY